MQCRQIRTAPSSSLRDEKDEVWGIQRSVFVQGLPELKNEASRRAHGFLSGWRCNFS